MINYLVQYSIGEVWQTTGGYTTKEAAQKAADKINSEWQGDINEPHDAEIIEESI
jgi:uncharacterized protein YegP (UPF0339 family)